MSTVTIPGMMCAESKNMQTWKAVSVCLKKMVTQTHTKILVPIKSDKKKMQTNKQTNKQTPNPSDPNEYRVIEHNPNQKLSSKSQGSFSDQVF